MFGLVPKPTPSMRTRIFRALDLGPCHSQLELGQRVLGTTYSLEQWNDFAHTFRSMLMPPVEMKEEKRQVPSTGVDGPAVWEYIYSRL